MVFMVVSMVLITLAVSFFVLALGFWKKGGVIVLIGGVLLMFVGLFVDGVIVDSQFVEAVADDYVYNEVANTATPFINAVQRSIVAEYPSSSSSLLFGSEFDCISVPLAKTGSPSVATAVKVGVFDASGAVLQQFGNDLNVTALQATPSFFFFDFCLAEGESYIIPAVPGVVERVGIQYTAGDASNAVVTRSDGNNPFDSTVTSRQNFLSGSWSSTTGEDLTMQLYLRGGGGETVEDIDEFPPIVRIMIGLVGLMFMLVGIARYGPTV